MLGRLRGPILQTAYNRFSMDDLPSSQQLKFGPSLRLSVSATCWKPLPGPNSPYLLGLNYAPIFIPSGDSLIRVLAEHRKAVKDARNVSGDPLYIRRTVLKSRTKEAIR